MKYDSIVIGGGIGGAASAFRAAQNGQQSLWLLGDKKTRKQSRSQWVMNLDNIIGFHEDVIKKQVIKTLQKAGESNGADLIKNQHYHINNRMIIQNTIERLKNSYHNVEIVEGKVIKLEKVDGGFEVYTSERSFFGTAVVLATGVMDNQPSIRGLNKRGELIESSQWIYPFANREQILYCIRCEGHLTRDEQVAVLGYTNMAAELAMMLYERYGNKVFILTNGELPEISESRKKILDWYSVEIVIEPIVGILSEGVKQLHGFTFPGHEPVNVKFALVSLGLHRVYNELARQIGARLMDEDQPEEKRHIWINHKGETSVRNLFVVGDAAKREDEIVMKQVYTAQEYAVRAVDTIDSRRRRIMREEVLDK